jgi:hypothetical protein
MAGRPRRNPVTAAEAEPEGSPEPAPELVSETEDTAAGGAQTVDATSALSSQIAGLEGLITRLVSTVEVQNEKLADSATVQASLLARIERVESGGAAVPAVGAAAAAAPAPAPAALTALEARLLALETKTAAAAKAAKTKAADVDPDDELDYVPYYEGRGLNPHQVRPQGVTDKPQLYPLKEQGYEVYKYLFGKKNAAYHEIGTLACALSYFWDSLHLLDSWKEKFGACGDPNAVLAVEALDNSLKGVYGLLNRRKNLVELRATCESNSPKLQPTDQEKKLFEYLSKQLDGFANNHGLDSSIDPYFKAIILKFEKESSDAALKQLTKDAGAASVRTPNRPKAQKPTPNKSGAAAGAGGDSG